MKTLAYIQDLLDSGSLILDERKFLTPYVLDRFDVISEFSSNEKDYLTPDEWAWKEEVRYFESLLALSLIEDDAYGLRQIDPHILPDIEEVSLNIERLGGSDKLVMDMQNTDNVLKKVLGKEEYQKRFEYMMRIRDYYVW